MQISIRETFHRIWSELDVGHDGQGEWRAKRLETQHPLDVFAAVRETDLARGVLFECPTASSPMWRLRFDSEGFRLLDQSTGRSGTRCIALALERPDLEAVFLVIAEDLIASSMSAAKPDEAVTLIGSRLAAWQACLKVRRDGFSHDQRLGLFGELILLERLSLAVGMDLAIAAWKGPQRGLHDFASGKYAIEVKTSLGAYGLVHVGSLDQLHVKDAQQLALFRVVLVPDEQGNNLQEIVARIRTAADQLGHTVRNALDQRVLMSGYLDADGLEVEAERYAVAAAEPYDVRAEFPCLTKEMVRAGVASATYSIDMSFANSFLMAAEQFDVLLMNFGRGD